MKNPIDKSIAKTSLPPLHKRLRRRIRGVVLRGLVSILGLLPYKAALRLGRTMGHLAFWLAQGPRKLSIEHLSIAFPDAKANFYKETARQCFIGLMENALELCVVRRRKRLVEDIVIIEPEDIAPLEEALAEGKGCIVITGHIGNWELAGHALAKRGFEVVAVARKFNDRGLGNLLEEFRTQGGIVTLPRGAPGTARGLLRQLRNKGLILMLVDQDTSVPSVFVPFFGRQAKTPRGPADIALKNKVEIVTGFIHREGKGGPHRLSAHRLEPPEPTGDREQDVRSLMARINLIIEQEIRRHPSDWVWFHERWKSPPE